jgi:GABA(A) receptor-associated protein
MNVNNLQLKTGELDYIKRKYPDKVPIFVTKANINNNDIPNLPKNKFLVSKSLTVGNFIFIVRRYVKLPPEKAMFLFIGNTLPITSSTIGEVYGMYKDSDGALRMTYTSESTFG